MALWWRLRRSSRHQLHQLFVAQPIRGLSMLLVLGVMWLGIAGLGHLVLSYLSQEEFLPLKPRLLHSLVGMFFFALFWLITFSNAIIVWGALLRNEAALFHAHLPLNERSLYWGATVEGGLFASWAAVVLALPLIVILGREAESGPTFVAAGLATVLAFLLLCLSLGSWAAMLLARVVWWVRRHLVLTTVIAAVAVTVGGLIGLLGLGGGRPNAGFLRQAIAAVSFTESPYLPPAWAQEAIAAALRGHWTAWAWHSGLLLAVAGAFALAAEHSAQQRLRSLLNLLSGRLETSTSRGTTSPGQIGRNIWPEGRWLDRLLGPGTLLLVRKDLRLFRRDPAQILQFALYFGLLGLYMVLLPRFDQSFQFDDRWRPIVSLLNLTAVAMALATFTGRFVFPLLGQEGKRLWILALAPWPRSRIVHAKFVFALTIGLPVSVGLVLLSGILLGLPPRMIAYQGLVATAMACGCAAMSLGLGAALADYRENDAGKVAAGYGGTINLLASLVFIILLMVGAALPIFSVLRMRYEVGILWTISLSSVWTTAGLILARRSFNAARITS